MNNILRTGIIGVVAAGVAFAPQSANAASKASIKVSPASVAINATAKIQGTGLKPSTLYTVMFAMPSLNSAKVKQLIGAGKTDAKGKLALTIAHMPIVVKCGSAHVYAFRTGNNTVLSAKVKMTGCTIKGSGTIAPPPPPGKQP